MLLDRDLTCGHTYVNDKCMYYLLTLVSTYLFFNFSY